MKRCHVPSDLMQDYGKSSDPFACMSKIGCEYKTVTALFDLIADGKVKVDQILVELHVAQSRYGSPEDLNTFFTAMDKAGMRIFHKERNQWFVTIVCHETIFIDAKSNHFLSFLDPFVWHV